jgi:diaminohydroxyphosphoribosylaminopyrimidine deaminase/5-amino-6-(5-phosphoribosylamino)uracil reductase
MTRPDDLAYMEMAYGLAAKAVGRSSPNPLVGALIVRDGVIVGRGTHEEAGKPHAEIMALAQAGRRARGATLYVTLEPCVHWGRTPPCADAVLGAGFSRVVVSAYDPNPVVHRKGVRKLERAGLDVEVGLLAERNARLNETYVKYITRRVPFVTLKAAVSLDGKTACRSGDSRWISSAAARDYVHLVRGEHDALMVGVNTLLADDPLLTVRHPNWGRKQLTRVVLDSKLRFPRRAKILATLDRGPILVFAAAGAPPDAVKALRARGLDLVVLDGPLSGPGLEAVLEELGRREITSLLVEGGSRLFASFVERRLADKILLFLAPKLIGGQETPGLVAGHGAARVCEALALKSFRTFGLDGDLVLEGYF